MLIEFQVENFRSLRKRQVFSMVAAAYPEHARTHTFDPKLPGFDHLLRAAAIYGPNAAGKTNVLRALQFMQNVVLHSAAFPVGAPPPFSPFAFEKVAKTSPSEFQITFVEGGKRYEYGFSLDAERFRDEWLVEYVNPRGRTLFERSYSDKRRGYHWKISSFLKGKRAVWSEATRPNTLFLSTAIQLNNKQLLPVFEWFQRRLVIIVGNSKMNAALTLQLLQKPNGSQRVLPFLKEADLGITGVDAKELEPNVFQVAFAHTSDDKDARIALAEESSGTQVLFTSAGAWLNVFDNGEVLLFDEIDTSLHPLLTRFIIGKFHSNVANLHNAQLIFTTHNTTFLDQSLFRRDQIWFIEKDGRGASKLYPLSDFKPRNDEVLENWYLRGRYGALPILEESTS